MPQGKPVKDRYRQTRRKLAKARKEGLPAVTRYLRESFMARRLVGLELGRPATVEQAQLSRDEIQAYQHDLVEADKARADAFGSEEAARAAWRSHEISGLMHIGAQALVEQLYNVGDSALLFFGFADNTSRTVTLHRAGTATSADGVPNADIGNLVARLFGDIHGIMVVIASKEGAEINSYDSERNCFTQTAKRAIRVVAVVNQHPIYFEPERAKECLETGDAFSGYLPRLPGATYAAWPDPLDPTDQE